MVCLDSISRRAITLRIVLSGSSVKPSVGSGVVGTAAGADAVGRGAGAPGAPAGAAAAMPEDFAPSTSALTMRPWGPEPWMRARSRLASLASRRASGLAKMRWPSLLVVAGADAVGVADGCVVAAAGLGAGAAVGA